MAGLWRVKDAFGYFGAVPTNIYYSWSALSPDGRTVVVNWWKDIITCRDGKLVYDTYSLPNLSEWRNRRGNRERIKHLAHARDHCDGLFRIVWTQATDKGKPVRETVERYPDKELWMRLIKLNEDTGQFLAEEVSHAYGTTKREAPRRRDRLAVRSGLARTGRFGRIDGISRALRGALKPYGFCGCGRLDAWRAELSSYPSSPPLYL